MYLSRLGPHEARFIVNRLRDKDREEAFCLSAADPYELLRQIVEEYGPNKFCASLELPICMFGAVNMWPGVWCGWALATDEFERIALPLTRHIKRTFIPSIIAQGCHRFEVYSLATHERSHRWLEVLGGRREATLKGYGRNGENFVVYALDFDHVHAI